MSFWKLKNVPRFDVVLEANERGYKFWVKEREREQVERRAGMGAVDIHEY
jgi:hypothetical protein